jgi:hypothetical protein
MSSRTAENHHGSWRFGGLVRPASDQNPGNLGLSGERTAMTEAELKAFIVNEVRKQTMEVFEPMLKKCEQLVEQVSALHKKFIDVVEEEKRYRLAMILKLTEIERSLGIDPDEAASTRITETKLC